VSWLQGLARPAGVKPKQLYTINLIDQPSGSPHAQPVFKSSAYLLLDFDLSFSINKLDNAPDKTIGTFDQARFRAS
jgi:hypothetical protein